MYGFFLLLTFEKYLLDEQSEGTGIRLLSAFFSRLYILIDSDSCGGGGRGENVTDVPVIIIPLTLNRTKTDTKKL